MVTFTELFLEFLKSADMSFSDSFSRGVSTLNGLGWSLQTAV